MAPDELVREVRTTTPTIPLALRRGDRYLPFHSESSIETGDHVIFLEMDDVPTLPSSRFDRLVEEAVVLDLDEELEAGEFFDEAAHMLADRLNVAPAELTGEFADREAVEDSQVMPGIAVLQATIEGENRFALLLARCRGGIAFPEKDEPVHVVFVLVTSPDERNFYLRSLAAIAKVVQSPEFDQQWMEAPEPEVLRRLVRHSLRRHSPRLMVADDE